MTFVESFYSFNLDISNVDRSLYLKTRVKTPKHPYETLHHLVARMLAFAHCYDQGLAFSRGLFAPEEPTIWKKDVVGALQLWVQVGHVDSKKLQVSLRRHPDIRHVIYLFEESEVAVLSHAIPRIRLASVKNIVCHKIDGLFLEQLALHLRSASNWQITFIDGLVYLTSEAQEFHTKLEPIDLRLLDSQTSLQDQ